MVKKKLSKVKGGKLAQYFSPTPIIALLLSDVADNDISVIASGPFTRDEDSFQQSIELLSRYEIEGRVPRGILSFLHSHEGELTPSGNTNNVEHIILADNRHALNEIRDISIRQGIDVVMRNGVMGETKEVAADICSEIRSREIHRPTLFLYGGETTVTLPRKHGTGGRNQEFVSTCLNEVRRAPFNSSWCVLSIGTDGVDYIDESSGGIVDGASLDQVIANGVDLDDYLDNHNSYHLLELLNSNITVDGTTGTNVGDIMMFLMKPKFG